jgi:hypothetical protein
MVEEIKTEAIANPASLGLAAFGLTTVVLSLFNANILPISGAAIVVPLAMAYGGTGQFLAGMWEFKRGNIFGATAFSSFGTFWWFYALLNWSIAAGIISLGDYGAIALAAALAAWGLFTFYMWIASFKINHAVCAVFLTLWITFFLLSAGELYPVIKTIGGYVGLLCGLIALYTSAAIVINETFGKTVVPVGKPLL